MRRYISINCRLSSWPAPTRSVPRHLVRPSGNDKRLGRCNNDDTTSLSLSLQLIALIRRRRSYTRRKKTCNDSEITILWRALNNNNHYVPCRQPNKRDTVYTGKMEETIELHNIQVFRRSSIAVKLTVPGCKDASFVNPKYLYDAYFTVSWTAFCNLFRLLSN